MRRGAGNTVPGMTFRAGTYDCSLLLIFRWMIWNMFETAFDYVSIDVPNVTLVLRYDVNNSVLLCCYIILFIRHLMMVYSSSSMHLITLAFPRICVCCITTSRLRYTFTPCSFSHCCLSLFTYG